MAFYFMAYKWGLQTTYKSWDDPPSIQLYMCQGLNFHYFHIIGDKLINPSPYGFIGPHYKDSVIKGGIFPIPNIATFDHGTGPMSPMK